MRRALLATSLAFVLLAWPAGAQDGPAQPSDTPPATVGARTIMDAVFWALPGDVDAACLQLPPSQISITLRLEDDGTPQPVRFTFAPYWFRAADSPAEIDTGVTVDPRTIEATLAGGRYCYTIANEGGPADDAISNSTGQAQLVGVKMALTP
jgi:hypothetical protein